MEERGKFLIVALQNCKRERKQQIKKGIEKRSMEEAKRSQETCLNTRLVEWKEKTCSRAITSRWGETGDTEMLRRDTKGYRSEEINIWEKQGKYVRN